MKDHQENTERKAVEGKFIANYYPKHSDEQEELLKQTNWGMTSLETMW